MECRAREGEPERRAERRRPAVRVGPESAARRRRPEHRPPRAAPVISHPTNHETRKWHCHDWQCVSMFVTAVSPCDGTLALRCGPVSPCRASQCMHEIHEIRLISAAVGDRGGERRCGASTTSRRRGEAVETAWCGSNVGLGRTPRSDPPKAVLGVAGGTGNAHDLRFGCR